MYISQLTEILGEMLAKYGLLNDAVINQLSQVLEDKKYDLQDQALIEAIINDKEKQLLESLEENYDEMIRVFEVKYGSVSNTDPQIINSEIVSVFIKNLEYYIDYFYNSLLNKHFISG